MLLHTEMACKCCIFVKISLRVMVQLATWPSLLHQPLLELASLMMFILLIRTLVKMSQCIVLICCHPSTHHQDQLAKASVREGVGSQWLKLNWLTL